MIGSAPAVTEPLPRPYDQAPAPEALRPSAATLSLAQSQVRALLTSSAAFHALPLSEQRRLSDNVIKIAAYSAELIRDDWCQSARLGQTPVVRHREVVEGPVAEAQAAGDDFKPAAAGQVARVTSETLKAVAFPTFVADLIKGTFNAIVQASIQQMEAYTKLLENVSKTVDQFMQENISDNQAKDWLAQSYPDHIRIEKGNAVPQKDAENRPPPNWRADLSLSEDVDLDESSIAETLVPAARRRLAQSRLQLLSTMVLMGMNRIVVTGGKIRATMGFHIDAKDRAHEEHATDLDARVAAAGSYGFGPWSISASTSVAYVNSTRKNSDAELNVETDLTGEVEIHFKSDYFPLERFAGSDSIGRIQANTAVPATNTPPPSPFSEPPAVGGEVGRFSSPRTKRSTVVGPPLRAIGTLPEARAPEKPTAPVVEAHVDDAAGKTDATTTTKDGAGGETKTTTAKKDEAGGPTSDNPATTVNKEGAGPVKDTPATTKTPASTETKPATEAPSTSDKTSDATQSTFGGPSAESTTSSGGNTKTGVGVTEARKDAVSGAAGFVSNARGMSTDQARQRLAR